MGFKPELQYIATEAVFEAPEFELYHKRKSVFIKKAINDRQYHQGSMATKAKWRQVTQALLNEVRRFYGPGSTYNAFETGLLRFRSAREKSNITDCRISLESAVDYYENFLFLFANKEPFFKLTNAQKKELLKDLIYTFGKPDDPLCDPGILTRFEEMLAKYRRTTDWIANELHENRRQLLTRLHDNYNHLYQISDAYASHTMLVMSQLAETYELGIRMEHLIEDAYLSDSKRQSIEEYFNQVYERAFYGEYLDNIVDNLSYHVFLEIRGYFEKKLKLDLSRWQLEPLAFGNVVVNYPAFQTFLKHYFDEDAIKSLVSHESEDYQTNYFFKEAHFRAILQDLVRKKLESEGYFIGLRDVKKEDISELNLRGYKLEEMVDIYHAFSLASNSFDVFNLDLINKHRALFSQYPNILLSHHELLAFIPSEIVNHAHFIKAFNRRLFYLLSGAEDSDDLLSYKQFLLSHPNLISNLDKRLCSHKSLMLFLIANDIDVSAKISSDLLYDTEVANALVRQSGLNILILPKQHQDNKALIKLATQTLPLDYDGTWFDGLADHALEANRLYYTFKEVYELFGKQLQQSTADTVTSRDIKILGDFFNRLRGSLHALTQGFKDSEIHDEITLLLNALKPCEKHFFESASHLGQTGILGQLTRRVSEWRQAFKRDNKETHKALLKMDAEIEPLLVRIEHTLASSTDGLNNRGQSFFTRLLPDAFQVSLETYALHLDVPLTRLNISGCYPGLARDDRKLMSQKRDKLHFIKKQLATKKMLTKRAMTERDWQEISHYLTPEDCLKVHNDRVANGLPACTWINKNVLEFFNEYCKEDFLAGGYTRVIEHARERLNLIGDVTFLSDNYHKKQLYLSIVENDNWYDALVSYQKRAPILTRAFGSFDELQQQALASVYAFCQAIYRQLKAALKLSLFFAAYILNVAARSFILGLINPTLYAVLILATVLVMATHDDESEPWHDMLYRVSLNAILFMSCFLSFIPFLIASIGFLSETKEALTLLTYSILPWITRPIYTLVGATTTIDKSELTAYQKLEIEVHANIERLTTSGDESAKQKGRLLNELWLKVKHQLNASSTEEAINRALIEKHDIFYADEHHTLSYWQVSQLKRDNSLFFKVQEPVISRHFSFFRMASKSESAVKGFVHQQSVDKIPVRDVDTHTTQLILS